MVPQGELTALQGWRSNRKWTIAMALREDFAHVLHFAHAGVNFLFLQLSGSCANDAERKYCIEHFSHGMQRDSSAGNRDRAEIVLF